MASKDARKQRSNDKHVMPAVILLVDDYQDGREMYADALTFAGFQVIEAASGPEALRAAAEHAPDLILMDLSLPGIDGWEVTSRLKADSKTRHLRVIALTAHALDGEKERAEQAGCDGFIPKPCLPDELQAKVEEYLARFRGERPAPHVKSAAPSSRQQLGQGRRSEGADSR